jgi:hypothetical protein
MSLAFEDVNNLTRLLITAVIIVSNEILSTTLTQILPYQAGKNKTSYRVMP